MLALKSQFEDCMTQTMSTAHYFVAGSTAFAPKDRSHHSHSPEEVCSMYTPCPFDNTSDYPPERASADFGCLDGLARAFDTQISSLCIPKVCTSSITSFSSFPSFQPVRQFTCADRSTRAVLPSASRFCVIVTDDAAKAIKAPVILGVILGGLLVLSLAGLLYVVAKNPAKARRQMVNFLSTEVRTAAGTALTLR